MTHSQVTGEPEKSNVDSTRSALRTRLGMVASSHGLASFYGAKCLSEGGNVVDAAITTSAMLCVTQNNLCGLGGDLFALIKLKGKVLNLNGSGRASGNATIDFYTKEKGYDTIPFRGALAAVTVPGIVHAWGELSSKYGTMELRELLAPAITYARNGFPVTPNYSRSIHASAMFFSGSKEWLRIFVPNGRIPDAGTLLKQADLANSLEQIANEGASTFYSGSLGEKIARGISEEGGIIDENDLRNHTSTWQEPPKTSYRGLTIYETAPNSQAATALLWLNMLEKYDLPDKFALDSPMLFEVLIDTCLRSYAERAKQIADPEFHEMEKDFLTKEFAHNLLRSNLDLTLEASGVSSSNVGDTTYFAVGNCEGDCLSVIQSNYMGFGSGLVPAGTGLVLHNRGCYFSLDEKHHNSLQPGKRTFHTLCASLGEKEGKTRFAIGSMGGDIQPQVHVQLMTKILDYKVDPQRAIDAPRWIVPFTIYERPSKLYVEPGLDISELKRIAKSRGLSFEEFNAPSSQTGHAQAILFQDGCLEGGADPRGDGEPVGF